MISWQVLSVAEFEYSIIFRQISKFEPKSAIFRLGNWLIFRRKSLETEHGVWFDLILSTFGR